MKRWTLITALLLVTALLLTACADTGDTGGEAAEQELVVAMVGDVLTFDPQGSPEHTSMLIRNAVFDGLIMLDNELNPTPWLATDWEFVTDTQIVFNLRDDVVFSNGDPMTSADVVYSLKRACEMPVSASTINAIDPEGITAIDDYTVEVNLKFPYAPIINHLGASTILIMNEEYMSTATEQQIAEEPIGTGPFKMELWNKGDRIELVPNEHFWGTAPSYSKLILRTVTETAQRAIELETGGVDIAIGLAINDMQRLADLEEVTTVARVAPSLGVFGLNCQDDILQDVRVRQAIAYALDTDEIVDAVYLGATVPATSALPRNVWGYRDDLSPYTQNIDMAKQLLADAGYPDGFATHISIPENAEWQNVAEIAQFQLSQVGIDLQIKMLERGTYVDDVINGRHAMTILTFGAPYGDPDQGLYPVFHSDNLGAAGNNCYYVNDTVDTLLDEARSTLDEQERLDKYYEIQGILHEELPWIYLQELTHNWAYSNELQGFDLYSNANIRFENISFS